MRRSDLSGYGREQFGGDWAGTGEGRDVRERVLIREARRATVGAACRPTAGRWRSIYDGRILRGPGRSDIDRVVPLANAWRSGARRWTPQQREQFTNDLQARHSSP